MKILLALILGFISIHGHTTETPKSLERKPVAIKCMDELKRCTYVTQNITAQKLISRINAEVFPGGNLFAEDGYFTAQSAKEVVFWLEEADILERVKLLIPLMDTFEDFRTVALIKVTTEIFSSTKEGLANIRTTVASRESESSRLFTDDNGSLNIPIDIGNSLFSAIIGGEISRKQVRRVETITQLIPNLSYLKFDYTTKIYIPTPTTTKEELSGIELRGNVSIQRTDPDKVKIENLSFKYGVIDSQAGTSGEDRVNKIDTQLQQIELTRGFTHMVVQANFVEHVKAKGAGIISLHRNKGVNYNKVLVVMRADAISYEDYVKDLRETRTTKLYGQFSKNQIEKFPNDNVSLEDVLKAIRPYSRWTTSGDRIVGIKLDSSLARANNIGKTVDVEISGGLVDKIEDNFTVENLMISGVPLGDFKETYLNKKYFKIKVKLKKFKGKTSAKHTLYYNPKKNEFIE